MITDVIVLASLALTGSFLIVWLLSPEWRARIEQPKHQFQEALRQFEESHGAAVRGPKR